jgi:hypothetical protein|tara:strand:+ start:1277 stop:1582 length:306 start_codon:yes stop_codon:yes gene_type:complete
MRTNETDSVIEQHLNDARRSIRAAMTALQAGSEKGHRARRTQRDLRELEHHTYRVSSVVNPHASDPDLMSEDQRAEIYKKERLERQAKREAKIQAAEVTNG